MRIELERSGSSTSPIEVGFIRLRQFEMPISGKPEMGGRGRRAAPGERLSEKSSCIGVLGTRIACFCVKADQQFVGQSNADGHFVFSCGEQSVTERAEALVIARGNSGDEEQDRANARASAANRPLAL